MIGQTVSHYKIVRQLGAGGMGVVYAAEDPRLNRQVALKFVPEELAHDPHALDRLRSEARTASGLNHPNICTIYDIGEHQGRPFIVMELLKGQTLRECMTFRPLKVHETVDIGIQVADALYWAHTRDVIHRDIKPANLFLVDQGPLKILDFGLAKLVQAKMVNEMTVAPTVDLTAVGVALGTVAYMSPEQVTGDTLDRRTDLFSLGVVLYECATGQQPFKGKTSAVVLASILTQAPIPPIAINAETPLRLQEIIHNCLEKDRELRYQDAAALRTDLRRLKRDLESGASGAMRTAAAAVLSASSASTVLTDSAALRNGQTSRRVTPHACQAAACRCRSVRQRQAAAKACCWPVAGHSWPQVSWRRCSCCAPVRRFRPHRPRPRSSIERRRLPNLLHARAVPRRSRVRPKACGAATFAPRSSMRRTRCAPTPISPRPFACATRPAPRSRDSMRPWLMRPG